jgi:hypothetical protein
VIDRKALLASLLKAILGTRVLRKRFKRFGNSAIATGFHGFASVVGNALNYTLFLQY